MPKTSQRRALIVPSGEENRRITSGAMTDPDATPLTKAQLQAMVPLDALLGRPKSPKPNQPTGNRKSRKRI
jgi:hypothetical protein